MTTETPTDAAAKSAKELAGTRMPQGPIARLEAKSFSELTTLANFLATSNLVPKDMQGKPANVMLVLMFGNEIGITPVQALQSVFVVNGRPTLFGDAVMGLVLNSSVYEDSKDSFDEQTMTATFSAKRKGKDWVVRTFSQADAVKAELWKKEGPWQQYPKRMLFHRARSWALRDSFADVLKGFRYYEEEIDSIPMQRSGEKEYSMPAEKVAPASAAPIETTAAPAQVPTSKPTPEPEKKPEGNIFEIQVSGAATTDFEGDPDCYVIRDRSETPVKFYTQKEDYFKLAQEARDSGAKLAGVFTEKPSGKHKVRWILALQKKD